MPRKGTSRKEAKPGKPHWTERGTVPVSEGAQILGISRNLAYDAVNQGQIPALEFGRRKVIPTAWIKKQIGLEDTR